MRRLIEAPGAEWLTEREFADYLGLGLDLFRELLKDGTIPPPRKWTHRTKGWHWELAYWVSLGLKLGVLPAKNLAPGSGDEGG
jgi:hypothetical protein